MSANDPQIQAAIRLSWETGRLKRLLKPVQKEIYDAIKASSELTYVVNCSRRIGKTTTLGVIATETAIQYPEAQVHFGAPYQNALKDFLLPIFNQILSDCPTDLRPKWKPNEGKFVFPNGSTIKLCGANNGQFENLRGNKSDLFILDEAAQVDELDAIVKDVALPQLLSSKYPGKKIILPSTPPNTPDHPYKLYAEKAKSRGAYSEYDIERSWYSKEEIERFIEEMGGKDSTRCQRELFCKFVTDASLQIIPEWNTQLYVQEVKENDYFQFYFVLEGMDVGYRDFTTWVLGYYDFLEAKLYIKRELAMRENEFRTDKLAELIKKTETDFLKENKSRIRRIADNSNLNILADLSSIYKLPFAPVSKKNGKEWMVNQLRQAVKAGKVIIDPSCKMLISSLEFGIWKKNRDDFDRSPDLGHYDFIDALIYMVAVLLPTVQNVNPIPPLYKINVTNTMFPNNQIPVNEGQLNGDEAIKKIFPKIF